MNGLATKTSMNEKKIATPPSTGVTQARSSRDARRSSSTAADEKPVRISSHSSSEPSCPPQNAEKR